MDFTCSSTDLKLMPNLRTARTAEHWRPPPKKQLSFMTGQQEKNGKSNPSNVIQLSPSCPKYGGSNQDLPDPSRQVTVSLQAKHHTRRAGEAQDPSQQDPTFQRPCWAPWISSPPVRPLWCIWRPPGVFCGQLKSWSIWRTPKTQRMRPGGFSCVMPKVHLIFWIWC